MTSVADPRDVLPVPRPSTGTSSTATPGAPNSSVRKDQGITRELYSLIGDSVPTLVAQYARPKLKSKPKYGLEKVQWEWKEFKNPSRTDDLQLAHWVKMAPLPELEQYPFAKYNHNPNVSYDYSMDEYSRLLDDSDWTKEETDYLFAIVKEYDIRFYVIADRYDFPGGKPRSIQDIKARYYYICRKLIRNRPFAGDEASKNAMVSSYSYDREREIQRKAYLNGLFARSPAQIAQEEALYIELKRIEQNERRFQRERDDLLRTLTGVESGMSSLAIRINDPSSALPPQSASVRRQKRGEAMEVESPVAGTSMNMIALPSPYSGSSNLPGGSGRHKSQSISSSGNATPALPPSISLSGLPNYSAMPPETTFDPVNCLTQVVPSSAHPQLSATKAAHRAVHLRSSLIPVPKAAALARINGIISETGLHPGKLVMPTAANIERMEALQAAAGGLADMKRLVDKVEQEVKILKARLRGASEAEETDMGGGGDGERGQTMDREMSSSTGLGDKRLRRSTSVTSSTASMAAETRAQKRQRRG
ncbi:swr complex subunit [Tulasnella sp. 330]|nr:swr complex subunit [Tulasnella sp. 330]KAG8881105.1 swr complex subunit [Tulasnella sp. 331]KAG8884265.1 swr complex subunit [Tulasnella sp. 332]